MIRRATIGLLVATTMAVAGLVGVLLAASRTGDSANRPVAVVNGQRSPFAGSVMPPGVRAPDFELRDERGRRVAMADFRGTPVVVAFLYSTCEESCPVSAQVVRGALDELGRDLPALAVSVDPFRDTAASARRFNREQRVTGRLRWVLGTRRELLPVWGGFAVQPQLRGQEHQARITLVDKRGFQRVGWPVNQSRPELIARDLRVLLRE